jgi:cysteinyl-tRNA synthetase
MSKSKDNSFLPGELFSGENKVLDKGFSPMVVKFFMYQSHYRSTLDFSNDALMAAEKGFQRLSEAVLNLDNIIPSSENSIDVSPYWAAAYKAMNDDFNCPILIAGLFDTVKVINQLLSGSLSIDQENLDSLKKLLSSFLMEVLGFSFEQQEESKDNAESGLMDLILDLRKEAKINKNYAQADQIRDALSAINIEIKDTADGATWNKK